MSKQENNSIYNKISEVFGSLPKNFSVLEEQIDIDLQMKYFEFSKKVKQYINADDKIENKDQLFEITTSIEEKKQLLAELASVEEVESFRCIEKYLENPDPELRDWAILAMQESRMLIESKLLDQNQVFISTGLGGKGTKLRYFIVLISNEGIDFSETQKKVVKNEFESTLKKYNVEIEELQFFKNFSTLMVMIPIEIPIKDVFKEAIGESNQFGNFLKINFIVTNVKRLSIEEITNFIDKHMDELDKEEEGDFLDDEFDELNEEDDKDN